VVEDVVNTVVEEGASLGVRRFFTIPGRDPFDEIEWELRTALSPARTVRFEQKDVEFPLLVADGHEHRRPEVLRGRMSSPERERSVKQMIGRSSTIAAGPRRRLLRRRDRGETFEPS